MPKKIENVIKFELSSEYDIVKDIKCNYYINSLSVRFIVIRVERKLYILIYWADSSYSLLAGYSSMSDINNEIACQIRKHC